MAKIAHKRLVRKGYQPRLTLGDGRDLPFGDQCFDQIIATFPTEYFLDSKTLQEAYRTLAPKGQIIVVPMAWITGKSFVHRFLAWVFKVTGQSIDKNHPSFEMGKILIEQAGFVVDLHTISLELSEVLVLIANKTTHS
jgi:ubiquinone/menaquinone biosynthesis C-methylase UbiE